MLAGAGVEVDSEIVVGMSGADVKVEGGLRVAVAAAASGGERGGSPKFEQAAMKRINKKGSARFILLFVFYIHRVRIHDFILAIDDVHIAG
jgi:hypothetical protein